MNQVCMFSGVFLHLHIPDDGRSDNMTWSCVAVVMRLYHCFYGFSAGPAKFERVARE